ncbi:MAG TPA: copper ion binding protein [Rubrobacter sp.]|jgi:copper chaperone|nr:copper ion binding protein [Rubrobacter sp.]
MTEKTLKVPDMSCAHCKAAVEGELNRLSGVQRANADVDKGTVEVTYDEGKVTTEDLKGAIEEAGYGVAA